MGLEKVFESSKKYYIVTTTETAERQFLVVAKNKTEARRFTEKMTDDALEIDNTFVSNKITGYSTKAITEKDKQDLVVQRAARWLKPPEEEEKPKRKRRKKKDKQPERTTKDINKLADIIKKKTSA
tara:strand:- start:2852 stop:3229 length:378 start_codon:yes stop_codon:yes gene_type:complete